MEEASDAACTTRTGIPQHRGQVRNVDTPTFHIGGWYDCFIGETLRQYEAMKERSREAGLRPPHLLVGPWTHGDFGSTFGS